MAKMRLNKVIDLLERGQTVFSCGTIHLLYAPLTTPLVYYHINRFQRASRAARP